MNEEQKKVMDTRIVENLNPSLIIASNDSEVEESLREITSTNNLRESALSNMEEHKIAIMDNSKRQSMILNDNTTSNDWQANFTNVAIDNSMDLINQDVMAVSILANKSLAEQLLKNKAIVFQSVETDSFGKPKAFSGLKMLRISQDLKTQRPVLTLSKPQRYDFQPINHQNKSRNDLTAVVDYDIANRIVDKLMNDFKVNKDLSNDKDLTILFELSDKDKQNKPSQQLFGKDAFLVINAIQRIGHKYLLNENQRNDFYKSIEKDELATFSKDTTTNVKGATFLNRQKFPIQNVPTVYKGVKLTPLQSFQLAQGNPVSIEGIKDDKIEGLYTAHVKLDVFNGKKIETDKKVSTESLDKGIRNNEKIEKVVENKMSVPTQKLQRRA